MPFFFKKKKKKEKGLKIGCLVWNTAHKEISAHIFEWYRGDPDLIPNPACYVTADYLWIRKLGTSCRARDIMDNE